MTWKEPITDRTAADVTDADTSALAAQKGTLNAEDLNRIEGNYRYIMEQLEGAAVYIPHTYRRRQEKQIQADGTVTTTTYTDWQEQNLPWLSEINRIRANYTALVRLFLVGLDLPVFAESDYLDWQEVNDWERVADISKKMYEKMKAEYIFCGTTDSGGARLL